MKSAQVNSTSDNAVTTFIRSWGGTVFGIGAGLVLLFILTT